MGHILTQVAADELDQIWYYIAKESGSTGRADRIVDAITDRFYLLASYPRIGRERPDLRLGLRSFSTESHIIIYRIDEMEDVVILHVFNNHQDAQASL